MGKRWIQHSDLCGCERCAKMFECDKPYPVFDAVEDPDVLDCGCDAWRGCDCAYFDFPDDEDRP